MKELIQLFTQIALLRRGPQDVPASLLLLGITIIGYFGINFLFNSVMPPALHGAGGSAAAIKAWPAHLAVDVVFTLIWYVVLLRLAGRSERTLQTTTAVFGFQAVLSPLVVISEWLMLRFAQDTTWQLPVALMWLMLLIWVIAANSHVVKAALEWSSAASVALVILQFLAGQLVLFALFPVTNT
jgi:hypothetical protein